MNNDNHNLTRADTEKPVKFSLIRKTDIKKARECKFDMVVRL